MNWLFTGMITAVDIMGFGWKLVIYENEETIIQQVTILGLPTDSFFLII